MSKEVPLVWYDSNGGRHVIGTATVQDDFTVEGTITNKLAYDLIGDMSSGLSVSPAEASVVTGCPYGSHDMVYTLGDDGKRVIQSDCRACGASYAGFHM